MIVPPFLTLNLYPVAEATGYAKIVVLISANVEPQAGLETAVVIGSAGVVTEHVVPYALQKPFNLTATRI